jgi:hypothetical protein
MKHLGNGLMALGLLQALLTVGLPLTAEARIGTGILATLNFGLGILARTLRVWVNYLIAILAWLWVALIFVNMSLTGSNSDRSHPGSELSAILGIVVCTALLYYSVNNVQRFRRARATGLR